MVAYLQQSRSLFFYVYIQYISCCETIFHFSAFDRQNTFLNIVLKQNLHV